MPKVVCVTGANKGIGYETVKLFCQKLKPAEDYRVLLTARSVERGEKATETLKNEKLPISPVFAQLDITNRKHCEALRDRIMQDYGGLDMLVNNAGIGYRRSSTVPLPQQMEETLETNYFGTKLVTETLLPALRDNARIISVASTEAERGFEVMDACLRRRMLAPDLTLEELDQLMRQRIEGARHQTERTPLTAYRLSKAAVVSWTRVCAARAKIGCLPGLRAKNVFICCCEPGWCKTDMAGWDEPPLSAADGAATIVDVCLNAKEDAYGKYISKGVVVDMPHD